MCGIFGFVVEEPQNLDSKALFRAIKVALKECELRGKDSSGITLISSKSISVKDNVPLRKLYKSHSIELQIKECIKRNETFVLFGHSRLSTNGSSFLPINNQPVIESDYVVVHNGIIVNASEVVRTYNLKLKTELDSGVIPWLLKENEHLDYNSSVGEIKRIIKGTCSTIIWDKSKNYLLAFSNNRSLYSSKHDLGLTVLMSESHSIQRIDSQLGSSGTIQGFDESRVFLAKLPQYELKKVISLASNKSNVLSEVFAKVDDLSERKSGLLLYDESYLRSLKRCTKCVLPETFPYIEFDGNGECNYCNSYKPHAPRQESDFLEKVNSYRDSSGKLEVLIPFSGGRDSSYVVSYMARLNNIQIKTLTYDWGMVTDLARRNISRICSGFGVENLLVAPNIHKKRNYVRLNVLAWLNRPSLGMIPLFMAGDKYFFKHTVTAKKRNHLKLNVWGTNQLENTHFKVGFAGIKPDFEKEKIYDLNLHSKLRLFSFVAGQLIRNPRFINASVWDSLGSFFSRYGLKKEDYVEFYNYFEYNEDKVSEHLIDNFDWEKAKDTESTWRIGDGTASFYNYIYTSCVGFSENDTFRSNQIRQGLLSRNEALELVIRDNRPRALSIAEYLKTINVDFDYAIGKVNEFAKSYKNV